MNRKECDLSITHIKQIFSTEATEKNVMKTEKFTTTVTP
jgi:hypothetical protein